MSKASRPRIVMLCGDGDSSWFMYNALAATFEIVAVVVENKPPARAFLRHRLRKLGWIAVLGQVEFVLFNKILARMQRRRIAEIVREHGLSAKAPPADIVHRVASVNGAQTRKLLKKVLPDAVVVNGTRIISATVLQCIDRPFINTHAGITPRYRGVHGGYWALAQGDAQHCGVTVHMVDSGVDTGGVLYQDNISISADDGFNTYPVLQLAAAIPLMNKALDDAVNGRLKVRETAGPSRQWYHPTLRQYLWARVTRSVK